MPDIQDGHAQAGESSWPFDTGKGTAVHQDGWQDMTARMAPSAVSGYLGDAALNVKVSSIVVPGVDIAAGEAMVRGFCYKTTGVTVKLEDNTPSPDPRMDTIVLRLDMANNEIYAAALKGQPAASPKPRQLTQQQGGIWEFPLAYALIKKASNEIDTVTDCRMFSDGGKLPQAADPSKADPIPSPGDSFYMRDTNGIESLSSFSNRGGWAINEDIGKYRSYTPHLNYASQDSPKPQLKGHWKWISQNTVYFVANIINNDNKREIHAGGQQVYMNVDLPVKSRGGVFQVVNSVLFNNSDSAESEDNYWIGNAYISGGSTVQPVFQNTTDLKATGDWLTRIPHNASVWISGVYEADVFNEGNG
ncbi:hypothetical protein [Streptomyces sp. 769]|uniref:hypothetical protein n=1 Tax=Streptomyces sp. 769 TaxID=1262452 RepID=UPI0005800931|nr:hypothetical protein [Streptomyces sp. 769]AJC54004.1 hypothetical protein GZL_01404 [Streptomyces sp. 769]